MRRASLENGLRLASNFVQFEWTQIPSVRCIVLVASRDRPYHYYKMTIQSINNKLFRIVVNRQKYFDDKHDTSFESKTGINTGYYNRGL